MKKTLKYLPHTAFFVLFPMLTGCAAIQEFFMGVAQTATENPPDPDEMQSVSDWWKWGVFVLAHEGRKLFRKKIEPGDT